jgi:hypothetical protein
MRQMFWKELRDLRPWTLFGLGAAAAAALLFDSPLLANRFFGGGGYLMFFMPFIATVTAIGLGIGQVAKERHARTLDFLLVRPTPAGGLVWIKFAAGTVALALLLTANVAVGYTHREFKGDIMMEAVRAQVAFPRLALTLFPRYWLIYAAALFLSVLVDRTAKAAVAAGALLFAIGTLAFGYLDRSPFSSLPLWFPFFDESGGLLRVTREPALFWLTGAGFTAATLLVTFASGALLHRTPGRSLATRTLALVAATLTCGALLAERMAPEYLPVLAPAQTFDFAIDEQDDEVALAAAGERVVLAMEHGVRLLDFPSGAKPRELARISLPLWTTQRMVLDGDTAYLVGQRKAVPVDQTEIAIVDLRPGALVASRASVTVGPYPLTGITTPPVIVDGFLYLPVHRQGECALLVYDLSSTRGVADLAIDKLLPPDKGERDRFAGLSTLRHGSRLYVTSPAGLTVIDITSPARPVIVGRVDQPPPASTLYGFPRGLALFAGRLYETFYWPPELIAHDLANPDRPLARVTLPWSLVGGFSILPSERFLYQSWGSGIVEVLPGANRIESRRYLRDGDKHAVRDVAVSQDRVYAFKHLEHLNRVDAFSIADR